MIPPWLIVITPRWRGGASIGFFSTVLVLYVLAIPSLALGFILALAGIACRNRPGREPRGGARSGGCCSVQRGSRASESWRR